MNINNIPNSNQVPVSEAHSSGLEGYDPRILKEKQDELSKLFAEEGASANNDGKGTENKLGDLLTELNKNPDAIKNLKQAQDHPKPIGELASSSHDVMQNKIDTKNHETDQLFE